MRISDWSSDVCSSDLCADDAAHAMNAEYVQRIVHLQQALQAIHAPQADGAGDDAYDQRSARANQPRSGCYANQAGHCARDRAQQRRLAFVFPFDQYPGQDGTRSEEHTSELQSLMRISYAVFCLKKKK